MPFDMWALATVSPEGLASTAVVAGVRRCSSGTTMRRSVLRSRRLRRPCMARGSTGACSARSQDCVEPRLALWDGLQGRGGPVRARWGAVYSFCDGWRLSARVAGGGLRGALRERVQYTLDYIFWLAALPATASEGGAGCFTPHTHGHATWTCTGTCACTHAHTRTHIHTRTHTHTHMISNLGYSRVISGNLG